MNVCTYVICMYVCLCVCMCVCVYARSLACAHQSRHTKLQLRQCLSNFSNVCEPICFRCVQRSADSDTVPYLPSTTKPQRPLQKGKAELYINRMSMTILGIVGEGRTQTGISNNARYALGTVIFFNALLASNCGYIANVY